MLEKPAITDEQILACLQTDYGVAPDQITFLPIGADSNTAVYRADGNGGPAYFVKFRSGDFNAASIAVPRYLYDQGIHQVIPSLPTRDGDLWGELPPFKVLLYPFMDGQDGFSVDLTDSQWVAFGTLLKHFHTAKVPRELTQGVREETFSTRWRNSVRQFLAYLDQGPYPDAVGDEAAAFLRTNDATTLALIRRTDHLAAAVQNNPQSPFILCHADIHVGNLLASPNGSLYMIDWDTLVYAPKERDLMFVGADLGGGGHTPEEETVLFYQGYGPTKIDPTLLAYYRCDRILEDIAIYCELLLTSGEGGEDRAQSLHYLKENYKPGGTIELAFKTNQTLPDFSLPA